MQPQSGAERGAGLESPQRLLKQCFSRHWEFKDQKKKAAPAHSVCMVSMFCKYVVSETSSFCPFLSPSLPSGCLSLKPRPSRVWVLDGGRPVISYVNPLRPAWGGHLRMGFRERTTGIHGPVLTWFLSPRLCWVSKHGGRGWGSWGFSSGRRLWVLLGLSALH